MKDILTPEQYIVKRIEFLEHENNTLIEQLDTAKLCNDAVQDRYNNLDKAYTSLIEVTSKYTALLDELKQLLYVTEGPTTKNKVVKYMYDEKHDLSHVVTFEDERLFQILTELLGPFKVKEVK